MKNYKISIVGAGISGLYLAWKLSERGNKVTVFEKRDKVGKEACSGLVSERILEFIPQSQRLVENKINYCIINFPRKSLKTSFSKPFLVMNHSELDNLVLDLAKSAGTEILLERSIDFIPEGYDFVIGCDGPTSFVRRSLKLPEPQYFLAIQGFISKEDSSDFVETWPHKHSGFFWKIPRGKGIEYGIIGKAESVSNIFEDFLSRENLKLERIRAALVPNGFLIPKNEKITLCGDAAGLTKCWSGGGIIWGLSAADILLKNFPNFIEYYNQSKRFFLPKIFLSKTATKTIYFLGFNFPWLLPKSVKIESDFLI